MRRGRERSDTRCGRGANHRQCPLRIGRAVVDPRQQVRVQIDKTVHGRVVRGQCLEYVAGGLELTRLGFRVQSAFDFPDSELANMSKHE